MNLHEPLRFFNYAIPDQPASGDLHAELQALRAAFIEHQRQPRLEYIEQFAPNLAPALRAAGFTEEARMHLMVCTPTSYRGAPSSADVQVLAIDADSPLKLVRENLDVNNRGFNPAATLATLEDAEQFRANLGAARAFLALWDGVGAGAGMYTPPFDGLTELTGIATLAEFRRQSVASALTAHAARSAFDQGIEAIFLSAADEHAGRVYERVGFQPFATMLAYSAPAE